MSKISNARGEWLATIEEIVERVMEYAEEHGVLDGFGSIVEQIENEVEAADPATYYSTAQRMVLEGMDWSERDEAYEEARELTDGGESLDQFFCVMAHCGLQSAVHDEVLRLLEGVNDHGSWAEFR